MMTIRETVRQALTQVAGNKPFGAEYLMVASPLGKDFIRLDTGDIPMLHIDQVRRALRDILYVRKLADGRYVVKGRRVPPKVDITQPKIGH